MLAAVACCTAIQVLVPITEMRAKLMEELKVKTVSFQQSVATHLPSWFPVRANLEKKGC